MRAVARLCCCALAILFLFATNGSAQVPGPNINMVSGTQWPSGDPFLQRQNEPSMAVSTRNPEHLVAGSNDYRTVDVPFPPDSGSETGDAWVSVFTSLDGGQTWKSTLLPGYPQDTSQTGTSSPLHGFSVATDPTVRAGTHGLFYYSGLVFNRGNNAPSAVFVSTFQDQNNKGNGNPIAYQYSSFIDTGTSGQFIDKPWVIADVPRPGTKPGVASCNINGTSITSGKVYVFYTLFNGSQQNPASTILSAVSADCGKTWSHPVKISQAQKLAQGTVAAVDPSTGIVYVFWRQLASGTQPDAIQYAFSQDGGATFSTGLAYTFPAGSTFDQNASITSFRTDDLPAVAVDSTGRVWLAFSQRNMGALGTSRIMITTLASGAKAKTWSTPYVADPTATGPGHQFMPSLTFAYGKLMLSFYDNREDNTKGILQCPANKTCTKTSDLVEVRVPIPGSDLAAGSIAKVFSPAISDAGMKIRHTLDVRGALVDPSKFSQSQNLLFPSFRISQYTYGSRPGSHVIEQMKFNPPNFPMFVHGTRAFIGDYIDVAALTMVPTNNGGWTYNSQPSNAAVFHTTWTDNRDVRPPPVVCKNGVCTQDWSQYTPVGSAGGTSLYDPTQTKPSCIVTETGSKNENVYTSRITQGLLVDFKENAKQQLNKSNAPIQRAFSVFVRNTTNQTAFYRLTINTPPAGTTASFSQFGSLLTLDATVLPRTTISRTVFVTSSNKKASVGVSVVQITGLNGSTVPNGLQSTAVTNPDITNPDITNPDITNPDITNPDITSPYTTNPDITNAEVYDPTVTNPDITNPDITNPDITNPDITNPDITNPDITNPDITSVQVTNPDITNPDITNPDITNPDITNPDITNPDITNPDITNLSDNGGITDFTYKVTNKGNTSSSYNAKQFAKQLGLQCCTSPNATNCSKCQLIAHKTYPTPIANACNLTVEVTNIPISSIPDPSFSDQNNVGSPDNSGDPTNATISLAPGEGGRVTLRVFGPIVNTGDNSGTVKTIAVAGGADTGQNTAAASLAITTVAVPIAVVGNQYSSTLHSVGGVGATTWFETGALPQQLTLNSATGLISGPVTDSPGTFNITAKVQDSATGTQNNQPNTDFQNLTIAVNKLSIKSVTAANSGTQSQYLKSGDSATVMVTVRNDGPAMATNAIPSALSLNLTPAGPPSGQVSVSCGSPTPASANIASNSEQAFVYTCNQVSGNGFVSFSATATAHYVNTAADVLGHATQGTSNQLTVDTTPPVLTVVSVTTGANATPYQTGNWTNQSVTVTYRCTDNLSGLQNQPVISSSPVGTTSAPSGTSLNLSETVTLSSPDTATGSTSATCTDNAGNPAAAPSPNPVSPIMIDKTNPTLPTVTAVAGANTPYAAGSWTNQNVTVTFTCKDNLSGPGSTFPLISGLPPGATTPVITKVDSLTFTAATTLVNETSGSTLTASCTDNATNSASPTLSFGPIMIDKTPPVVNTAATAGANPYVAGTWTNQTVTVSYACADNASPAGVNSGVGTPPVTPVVFSNETANGNSSGTCVDVAGNSTTVNFGPIMIDKTPPVLTVSAAAGGNNYVAGTWTNQDVTVTYACIDNASPANVNSGLAQGSPAGSQTFTQETTAQGVSASGTCSDAAGNSATNAPLSFGPVLIDKTPPTVTGSATTGSNANYTPGVWTKDVPVTVTFACADTLSGASQNSITGNTVFSGQTAPTTVDGSCKDIAGNTGNGSFGPVQIDLTAPSIVITTPAPQQTFLLNSQITPVFTCVEGQGGIDTVNCNATPSASPYTATPVGPGTFSVSATDDAGNASQASSNYVVIYNFAGFQAPLAAAGPVAAPSSSGGFALSSTIPFRWTLADGAATPVAITDPSTLTSIVAIANPSCTGSVQGNGVTLFPIPQGSNSSFGYDNQNGSFLFNWDTSTLAKGGCYNVVVTLNDTQQYATIVNLEFTGFAAPLKIAGTPSAPSDSGNVATLADQNNVISVGWQLEDGSGNVITANDAFASSNASSIQAIENANCAGAPPTSSQSISLFAGGAPQGNNTYSFNSGQYTVGWNVSNLNAGSCYNLVLTLADGSSYATIVHN